MHVPTEDDWRSEEWNLDTGCAYANFHGKTIAEAVRLFEDNTISHHEDLMFMPSRAFGYYLQAYIAYLTSDAALGDADGADCFISLIEFRAQTKHDEIEGLWTSIEPVLKRLAERQADFDAGWVIYGCFRTRVHEIVRLGFDASFDTATPEIVPESVTIWDAACGAPRPLSLAVAAQVFRNSGIEQIDARSSRSDVIRVLGPPHASGGGDHPNYGTIADWFRYDRPNCVIHFTCEGEAVSHVIFSLPPETTDERVLKRLVDRAEAFAAWEALFSPDDAGADGDVGFNQDDPQA